MAANQMRQFRQADSERQSLSRWRGSLRRLALLGPAVSLAACGGAAASSPAASAPLVNLNAAYASAGANALPTWIAADEGLYRAAGLNVALSFIEGSVNAVPALAGGDVSMVDVTAAAAVQGQLKGLDTVALAVHVGFSREHLMAQAAIKDVADLKGKVVGAVKAGTLDDIALKQVLNGKGLAPGKDVSVSYFGTAAAQLAALQNGAIAATMVPAPYDGTAAQTGAHELLLAKIAYPADGVISTRKFIAEHRDSAVAFLTGYVQALRFIRANADESKRVLGKYTKQTDPGVVDKTYTDLLAVIQDDPTPQDDGIQNALVQLEGGEGKQPSQFIDAGPIREALARVH